MPKGRPRKVKITNRTEQVADKKQEEMLLGSVSDKEKKDHEQEEVHAGFIKSELARSARDKAYEEKEKKAGEERRKSLNAAAETILACLEPSAARDIKTASLDYKIHDIGLYILGLINRLVKTVDIFEPDIEIEWENGKVGYDVAPVCKYCGKEIVEPKNIKQIYCSNRCARRDRNFGETGVVFPNQHGTGVSAVEVEERQWEAEQRRLGAM